MEPASKHYPKCVRRLHWLVFALIVGAVAMILAHNGAEKGSALRANLKWAHFQFGVAVLLTMAPRLFFRVRLGDKAPPITPPLARWQSALAGVTHFALYLLLLGVPLLGFSTLFLKGQSWTFLGIPMPVASASSDLSRTLKAVHERMGFVLLALSIFHAGVALYHHLIRKDDALKRMLPPPQAD